MSTKDKQQCPIRLYPDLYKRVQNKIQIDGLSFQKLIEVLLNAYVKNNKEVDDLVKKYVDSKKRRSENSIYLDDIEKEDLFSLIEKESPLRNK